MRRTYSGQVVIYGAGAAGSQLANALMRDGNKYVAGFLDDDKTLQGRDVAGVRVYPPAHLGHLIETTGVKEVILSIPSVDASRRQEIVADLSRHQVKIRALPAISDLASGRYLVSQIREIDIDDILGRSSVPADPDLLRDMIANRVILVSGAGGSIGSELCKLITKWEPRKLVLFEANEFALYQVERELQKRTKLPVIPVLGSVCDEALVRRTLKANGVQVVFHAAAHKHVPLVEANVLEGIRNNVFGTRAIAEASFDTGVENFVLISTDKAVRPPNVMGATKRWAELVVRDCAERAHAAGTGQKFSAVRFGNVLGSNGSVVPLFKEQIANGGPVTVTDAEMTRYFMSIHEAAELIVQAGALSEGGDIFLLDMGEPVRILDLATNMIRLAGLSARDADNPTGDIPITIIGRRQAEKTHEELFYDPESAKRTIQPKIFRAPRNGEALGAVSAELEEMKNALADEDEALARRILFDLVAARDGAKKTGEVVPISAARKG
jgi:FlaA1/EpsC-like NDP-sugar epimerase